MLCWLTTKKFYPGALKRPGDLGHPKYSAVYILLAIKSQYIYLNPHSVLDEADCC